MKIFKFSTTEIDTFGIQSPVCFYFFWVFFKSVFAIIRLLYFIICLFKSQQVIKKLHNSSCTYISRDKKQEGQTIWQETVPTAKLTSRIRQGQL